MKYKEQLYYKDQVYKIGDKIQVYGYTKSYVSHTPIHQPGMAIVHGADSLILQIKFDDSHFDYIANKEQVRLLLLVKPREFTLFKDNKDLEYSALEGNQIMQCKWDEIIRVKEVLEDE